MKTERKGKWKCAVCGKPVGKLPIMELSWHDGYKLCRLVFCEKCRIENARSAIAAFAKYIKQVGGKERYRK